jgi:TRAP-type C4-dicarboxylate transport system permease small subunit
VVDKFVRKFIEWTLIVFLGAMVVLVFGNVVLRYGFNSGIIFSEEASRFLFMWITLLAAMLALQEGAHLGMTSIVASLPIKGRRIVRFISDSLMLVCCVLLTDGTWKQVSIAMTDRAPVTGIPLGVVFSGLLVCRAGMIIILCRSLWRQATGQMPVAELIPNQDQGAE